MTPPDRPRSTPAAIHVRGLSQELRHASDNKILQVTRMVDMLPERGPADLLLEPVRARLAMLRPVRPMTRLRLLLTPADPVLVPAKSWHPDALTLPRSIIAPLVSLIAPTPEDVRGLNGQVPGDVSDGAALTRLGAPLWADTARRLTERDLPAAWSSREWQAQHGLTVTVLAPLLRALRLLLEQAVTLRQMPTLSDAPLEASLAEVLAAGSAAGPLGWGVMLAMVLGTCRAELVMPIMQRFMRDQRLAGPYAAGLEKAAKEMLDRIEDRIDAILPEAPLDAALASERIALAEKVGGFNRLDQRPPEEQRRTSRLRLKLIETNHALFERSLRARLLPPVGTAVMPATGDPGARDETVHTLEAEAQHLRGLAIAAKRLGDGERYERLLQEAAARYAAPPRAESLPLVDRMRLVELFAGPEAAWAMRPPAP
ncbi:hypothetical protein [Rhizosaccharibacter radicis]|uniref:Uncharacterized protein n=1 Tax=Rhizosaccharibacter radicis TaxID=2782605 RepID=A0ABT1VY70_9PROT|nr:hypothetical protein [Acetobacteraceae bacterium KSS12]